MKLPMKESDVVKEVREYLQLKKIWHFRINCMGVYDKTRGTYRSNPQILTGVSDFIVTYKGKFIALEIKTNINNLTDNQREFMQNWTREGGIGLVVRNSEELEDYLAIISTNPDRKLFSNQHRKDYG